jgi:hypothetical protein
MEESSNFDSFSHLKTSTLNLYFLKVPPHNWDLHGSQRFDKLIAIVIWKKWSFKVSYKQEAYSNSRESLKLQDFDYPRMWYIMKVIMLLNVFYYEGVPMKTNFSKLETSTYITIDNTMILSRQNSSRKKRE